MRYDLEMRIDEGIDEAAELLERVRSEFDDLKDEIGTPDDVARPMVMLLSGLVHLVRDMREAGATIAEAPIEDEALVTTVANASVVYEEIKREVAHMEEVVARVAR